jgi:DNA-binding transcriptional ArsR family regulator
MKAKLEDVLKEKERELKLHQRSLNLKAFCEEAIFPRIELPVKEHVEILKRLIEKIIPDPKDRTEEMFSGEVFALLCTIYLHDAGNVRDFEWTLNRDILNSVDIPHKGIFLNYEIARRLDIPESAVEIINHLSFSNIAKKIPIEWEITDNHSKAIIRNTKIFEYIFNFCHLLVDMFYSDIRYLRLKRYSDPQLVLRQNEAVIDIDSKEGVISIRYNARTPYELHVLENARKYIGNMFDKFKNNVNGRFGFQYKEVLWDITGDFYCGRDIFHIPKFSPYDESKGPPFKRWDEASLLLDKLFDFGYVLVVGEASTGKTTLLNSFLAPQIITMSPNVFYCELWSNPTSEIRDVICKRSGIQSYKEMDIISICIELLRKGVCFFIIDGCERLVHIEPDEKEKLDRFLMFCMGQENVYLVISGDKDTFFEWYQTFHDTSTSAICEVKPLDSAQALDAYGEEKVFWDTSEYYKPIEFELLHAHMSMEKILLDLLEGVKDTFGFRNILSALVDKHENILRRYTVENIVYETSLDHNAILSYITLLKEKDIVKETESLGSTYYALTSRYLREPLYKVLGLDEFEEKKRVRNILKNSIVNETFLDNGSLNAIERWKDHMVFTKEEMGLILGSTIEHLEDASHFLEKAKRDGKGIDVQPILKFLYSDDIEKRKRAIALLVDIQDRNMINPLLYHLKQENVLEIRDLVIKGIGLTGKKKAMIAIMNTLNEIGDTQLRLKAIDLFYPLFGENTKQLLTDIRETEKDPAMIRKIDTLLAKLPVSS